MFDECKTTSRTTTNACYHYKCTERGPDPDRGSVPYPGGSVICCCYPSPPSLSASLAICLVIMLYILAGAFLFMSLEGDGLTLLESLSSNSSGKTVEIQLGGEMRARTVERLWSITEDLNILYKDNWTRLATQQVNEFQQALMRNLRAHSHGRVIINKEGTIYYHQQHHWSFTSSLLYSLTIITTIGYGSVVPRTQLGKLMTIIYALIGIPLMLIYLSTCGDLLARRFRSVYIKYSCNKKGSAKELDRWHTQPNQYVLNTGCRAPCYYAAHGPPSDYLSQTSSKRTPPTVPIYICLVIISLYIALGAFTLGSISNSNMLEGTYICFTSLSTIAFNDVMPYSTSPLAHALCAVYILIGMAIIAMCFNLIQEQLVAMVTSAFSKISGQRLTYYHHQDIAPLGPPGS